MAALSSRAKVTSLFLPAILLGFILLRKASSPAQGALPVVDAALPDAPSSDSASPMALAAHVVSFDVSYMRWLWWPVILYLFWGMAYVCDVYFVRTIDVISERFQIPDDVAGATLMALGCNGPEMALNTIAIFHPSNIGVGAVIGGEVFNVLVIIGTAILATPDAYLPLKLGRFTFFRDVIFYVVSVGILFWVLHDGQVTRFNTAVLLVGALCYTTTVAFSSKIIGFFSTVRLRRFARSTTRRLSRSLTHKVTSALSESGARLSDVEEESDSEEPYEADPAMVAQWMKSRECADPAEGSVLGVRVDVRNRMMDRSRHMEERYVWLRGDALLVSTAIDPTQDAPQLSKTETGKTFTSKDCAWHQGGLVNQPGFMGVDLEVSGALGDDIESTSLGQAFSATPIAQLSRPLINEAAKKRIAQPSGRDAPPALELAGFKEAPWEAIPLEDVLYCEPAADEAHFALHVHQHNSDLGSLITLEFGAKDPAVTSAWMGSICAALKEQRRGNVEAPEAQSCTALLMEWAEWLQFPVRFFLKLTIPDMDNPKLQHLYPVSFVMSMFWLAIFAFSVVAACDGIHEDFGISVTVLGFTVAAAGTSFPNVFSGMVVAKQGKTSMAIANALGANVQNVFLALAVPWAIQTWVIKGGPFPMVVSDLLPAVLECMITLMPVVLVYVVCNSSMPKWSGGLFLLTYVVYLVFALGQQITNCVTWPFPC
mmetsp:Transcript_43517/g.87723  ORF Transcript_43517/g.87723 Transcript_43517/m.87723 type:complete len:711 (-) Transcript_43517:390-2522(-)